MKIEIRRDTTESWFLLCHVGTLVEAGRVFNQQRARGYHVRISNATTGFLIQES